MKIGQYCQRQRCRHVELEQFWQAFASRGFVSDSWAFLLPARRYASAGNSDRNVSVCPSLCLSVTRRYCVKTKKASSMISSPSGSPKTLVFWRQISSPNSKGFPRTGASNKGLSEKFSDFLALSVNISKTVADTEKKLLLVTNRKSYTGFRLPPRSMTLDDLELHKFEFSVNFSGFRRFRTQQQLNAWR